MGAIAEGFVAFAQPLIDQTDGSMEQLQKAMTIAQLCFNFAILPDESREKAIRETQQSLAMDDEEFEAFRNSVLLPMIQRHKEMFPLMHRRTSTSEWQTKPSVQEVPRMTTLAKKSRQRTLRTVPLQ